MLVIIEKWVCSYIFYYLKDYYVSNENILCFFKGSKIEYMREEYEF